MTVYRQSVRLGAKPLETHVQRISFLQLSPCGHSTYVTSSQCRVTLRMVVYRQSFRLGDKPLGTHNTKFFQLNICSHNPYVTCSLTRRWVCRLQYCWSSLAKSFSCPSPAVLMTTFYCLRFENPKFWGRGHRIYIPQEEGDSVIPQPLGFLFLASYDSQGYGGDIRSSPLHMA
jgi:hypothetical protein